MATEPAADSELSVTLPPSLAEWLDERANALGIKREALLVQLLETHRSTAEIDDDDLVSLFESIGAEGPTLEPALGEIDSRVEAIEERLDVIDTRTESVDDRLNDADSRIDDVEAKLANNVEDIRKRVLQLRDAVEERAPAEHSHEELETVSDRLETVSAELEAVDEAMGSTADRIDTAEGKLETAEGKLDQLARAVVASKRRSDRESDSSGALSEIRQAANRNGTTDADCAGCGGSVRIGLLSEPACPYCERRFQVLETPESLFRWFKRPILTVSESVDEGASEREIEGTDEGTSEQKAGETDEWEPERDPGRIDE